VKAMFLMSFIFYNLINKANIFRILFKLM
jgi:hypothetical protein